VILRGPHGVVVNTPATGSLAAAQNSLVLVDRVNGTTSIALYKPAPGRWTIATAPGSPAIGRVQRANSLPAPAVRARVVKRGHRYRLVYRLHPLAGQHVTFSEQGKDAAAVIGTANGAAGSLAFTPAYGGRGPRRIVADVEQDGLPRERDTVASYRAPGVARLKGVTRLGVRRHATRATVSWRRTPGAAAYLVRVTYNGGFQKTTLTRATHLVVQNVFGTEPIVAAVTARDAHGRPGKMRSTRSAGHLPARAKTKGKKARRR
jgi:hypothetical protein